MTAFSDSVSQGAALDPAERPARAVAAQPLSRTFITCVRREIWEHNSVYLAPLIAAGVFLFAYLVGLAHVSHDLKSLDQHPEWRMGAFAMTQEICAPIVIIVGLIVAVAYCLGTLYNERRDRSILFWKSLPVSDATTVLAKAAVPMIVIPVVTFAISVGMQLILLGLSTVILPLSGERIGDWWNFTAIVETPVVVLYGVIVVALWYAPIFAWLMLVSAWARRGPFLWAVLPYLALCLVEKIALGTAFLGGLLRDRLAGVMDVALNLPQQFQGVIGLDELDPAKFFTSTDVWLGLAFAAACLAAAIWLRRYREPI